MSQVVNGFTRRTLRQALEDILRAAEAHELAQPGGCRYVNELECDRPCAIGSLLSPAQRQHVLDNGLNDKQTNFLWRVIGPQNMEFVTGLNKAQAEIIQSRYDTRIGGPRMLEDIRDILVAGSGTMEGPLGVVRFELDKEKA
jgi:hypothetical protein